MSDDKAWLVSRRQKKDGKVVVVGDGEPMTLREAISLRRAHTGCIGERYNDYFIHRGTIH